MLNEGSLHSHDETPHTELNTRLSACVFTVMTVRVVCRCFGWCGPGRGAGRGACLFWKRTDSLRVDCLTDSQSFARVTSDVDDKAHCLVISGWLWARGTRHTSCLGRMKAATVVFYSLFFAVSAAACFAMWLLDQWLAKYTLGAALPPVVLVSEWVEELGRRCKCLTTLGNAHTHTHTQPQQRATKTVLHQSQHPHAPASV
jgi:hypothetical protein